MLITDAQDHDEPTIIRDNFLLFEERFRECFRIYIPYFSIIAFSNCLTANYISKYNLIKISANVGNNASNNFNIEFYLYQIENENRIHHMKNFSSLAFINPRKRGRWLFRLKENFNFE